MKLLVYCIVRDEEPARACPVSGVEGSAVFPVAAEGLAAVVSRVPDVFAAPSQQQGIAFARVVEAFHTRCTVLPVRYGCLMGSEGELVALLRERRAEFLASLADLEGCVEMGIRVLLRETGEPAPAGTGRSEDVRSGRAYLANRQACYAARDGENEGAAALAERMGRELKALCVRFRAESSLPGKRRLLSICCLVRRSGVGAFRAAFGRFREGSAQRLLLSGPWPPYSFAAPTEEVRGPAALASNHLSPPYGLGSIESIGITPVLRGTAHQAARRNHGRCMGMHES